MTLQEVMVNQTLLGIIEIRITRLVDKRTVCKKILIINIKLKRCLPRSK